MMVKIITTIITDIDVARPDIINSDTVGDYKAELDAAICNAACDAIEGDYEDLTIDSVEPCYEGIDDYGKILDKWVTEYPKLIAKYEIQSV